MRSTRTRCPLTAKIDKSIVGSRHLEVLSGFFRAVRLEPLIRNR